MLELAIDKAKATKIKDRQYYVFGAPPTHTNYANRPQGYVKATVPTQYAGRGSNGSAKLHPDVQTAANTLMCALLDYGDVIKDYSMQSMVIQSGFREDDASEGANYLANIKAVIGNNAAIFGTLQFPSSLETEAQGVLGGYGDPRHAAFLQHVAAAPGWNAQLVHELFSRVERVFAPRGANPHSTGFVFDVDFSILFNGDETMVNGKPGRNAWALRSAAGMWLNKYSMQYNFDSYDTGAEIWHMEYRKPQVN